MYVRLAYNSVAKDGLGHTILLHFLSVRIAGVCCHTNYAVLGIEPKTSGMLGNPSTNRVTTPAQNDNFVQEYHAFVQTNPPIPLTHLPLLFPSALLPPSIFMSYTYIHVH